MTVEEAEKAIARAEGLGLHGAGFMRSLGPEKVAVACNGVGPAGWPESRRRKLGRWLRVFRPAFDVHDCEFTYNNDGGLRGFVHANDELEANCRIIADAEYCVLSPMRYLARAGGAVVADLCRMFGWGPWIIAYEEGRRGACA